MELSDLDYELPPELIAQIPAPSRDASRLLVIDRARGGFEDHGFAELPDLLRPGDCLVVNNSRVIPARVLARDAGGREVELLFFEAIDRSRWRALTRPGRRSRAGAELEAGGARLRVVGADADGPRVVERLDGSIDELLRERGVPPLPPYIERFAAPTAADLERYQTIYARPPGSVAAPTAGLHFTPALLDALTRREIGWTMLTLHVGPGTFLPVKVDDPGEHHMHAEWGVLSDETARHIAGARRKGGRIIAVGTTSLRLLESAATEGGEIHPFAGETRLFILPGYCFRAIDMLLTNFHLPRSTLLMLVAALAGFERIKSAYAHAVSARYRFFSYGDACLIERPEK